MSIDEVAERAVDRRTLHARERMLEAAEIIIATKGIDAFTVREVQEISEQKNKSAASYHFGSREGLIAATVMRTVGDLRSRRTQALASLALPLDEMSVAQLVSLLIEPNMIGVFDKEKSYEARFLRQCSIHPGLINMMRHRGDGQLVGSIRASLSTKLPDLPSASLVIRLDYIMTLVVNWLAQYEAFRDLHIEPTVPPDIARADLFHASLSLVEHRSESAPVINSSWDTTYTETWRIDTPNVKTE